MDPSYIKLNKEHKTQVIPNAKYYSKSVTCVVYIFQDTHYEITSSLINTSVFISIRNENSLCSGT